MEGPDSSFYYMYSMHLSFVSCEINTALIYCIAVCSHSRLLFNCSSFSVQKTGVSYVSIS